MKVIRQVGQTPHTVVADSKRPDRSAGIEKAGFRQVLDGSLKLSKHVTQRIDRRQLDLGPDRMRMLETAVDKAAARGARESLVLLDDLTLLVSVTNRTIITAMDKKSMKEGIFTQIDSAIIV